jgi:hypothetical protein
MWTKRTNPRQTHPSLFPLQAALASAGSDVPACPPRMDLNEQRAMQLIAQVRAPYQRPKAFLRLQDIPSPHGMQEVSILQPQAG